MSEPLVLRVSQLRTEFNQHGQALPAVRDVSFELQRGKILGLVGESGSGKSVTGFSLMGLIDPPGKVVSGHIELSGNRIDNLSPREWRRIQGKRMSMIFQDPMMTLNPVLRVETQMVESVRAHERVSRQHARQRSVEMLARMGIPSPEHRIREYPHQLSGGMRQRVAIAIAMLHSPELIIADEPTTALDVTIQSQILAEVQQRVRADGTSLIWITHDLSVVAGLADELAVMYAGQIVEMGSVDQVLTTPAHPYTQGLIRSLPANNPPGEPLYQIPGMMPSLTRVPTGCAFRDRCPIAQARCATQPPMINVQTGGQVRCHFPLQEVAHA